MKERNENRPGYKETKGGWIPNKWDNSKLGTLCEKITDSTHKEKGSV